MLGNLNTNNVLGSDLSRKMKIEEVFASVDADFENGKVKENDLLMEQAKRLQAAGLYPEAASVYRYEAKLRKYHGESTSDLPDPDRLEAYAETMRNAGLTPEQINNQLKQEE